MLYLKPAIEHANIAIIFYRQYPRREDRLQSHKRWLKQRPREWTKKKEEEHQRTVKQDELQSAEQKKARRDAKRECKEKELRQREDEVDS